MALRGKKKYCDPFLGKERYDPKVPCILGVRSRSKNLVSRTQGTKIALEELKGLATERNLADHEQRAQPSGSALPLLVRDMWKWRRRPKRGRRTVSLRD